MNFADRAARNEEIFRGVNEKIEQGAEQHGVTSRLPFHCECGSSSCLATIEMLPPEYERIVQERYPRRCWPALIVSSEAAAGARECPSMIRIRSSAKRTSNTVCPPRPDALGSHTQSAQAAATAASIAFPPARRTPT